MKLSTKGRYAITAMLDLALNANKGNKVTLADISAFQGISLSYLEQLFARLRQTKLVSGTRGPGGGYHLARPASDISIAEIIAAVDEPSTKAKVMKIDDRHRKTQQLWEILSHNINGYLSNISLADLIYNNINLPNAEHQTTRKIDPVGIWSNQARKHNTVL